MLNDGGGESIEKAKHYHLRNMDQNKEIGILAISYNPSNYSVTIIFDRSDPYWQSGTLYNIIIDESVRNTCGTNQSKKANTSFQTELSPLSLANRGITPTPYQTSTPLTTSTPSQTPTATTTLRPTLLITLISTSRYTPFPPARLRITPTTISSFGEAAASTPTLIVTGFKNTEPTGVPLLKTMVVPTQGQATKPSWTSLPSEPPGMDNLEGGYDPSPSSAIINPMALVTCIWLGLIGVFKMSDLRS